MNRRAKTTLPERFPVDSREDQENHSLRASNKTVSDPVNKAEKAGPRWLKKFFQTSCGESSTRYFLLRPHAPKAGGSASLTVRLSPASSSCSGPASPGSTSPKRWAVAAG